jgi:DNA-binding GntR family transcriptional regulator
MTEEIDAASSAIPLGDESRAGRSALSQLVYEGLRDEITLGRLQPGEVLSRRRIADRYGCSYTPVIEALVRLEHTGLIETESSQMARVRRLSVETIQNTYILREALETQAIRLACDAAAIDEIDELERLAEQVDDRIRICEATDFDNEREGPLLNWQFHKRIAEVSRCPLLVSELERIELLKRLQANWVRIPKMTDPPRFHGLLVDAIRARDALAADAAMRTHVRIGLEKELLGYKMRVKP